MLQRASSKRKKTSKQFSLNDQLDKDIENQFDDESSGEFQFEEKVFQQRWCSKAWQTLMWLL